MYDPLYDEPQDAVSPRLVACATELAEQWQSPVFIVGRQFCSECSSFPHVCTCDDSMFFWEMLIIEPHEVMSGDLVFVGISS